MDAQQGGMLRSQLFLREGSIQVSVFCTHVWIIWLDCQTFKIILETVLRVKLNQSREFALNSMTSYHTQNCSYKITLVMVWFLVL